jgi:hypothetical protein
MGCQQSTQANVSILGETKPTPDGKREVRIAGSGKTERLTSARLRQMQASIGSTTASGTVSLEADEEISKQEPKLNANGNLMPEEVVRRTSSSLTTTTIMLGSKKKGGRLIQAQVGSYDFLVEGGCYGS